MKIIALMLAVAVFIGVGDRVRLINWRTAKARYMVAHMAPGAMALWTIYDYFTATVTWWQFSGLMLGLSWLVLTHERWRYGVPPQVQSSPGDLGAPELDRP